MSTATMDNPDATTIALRKVASAAQVRRLRTMRQFALDEIVLPTGPYRDERLKLERNPWLGMWLDAVDSGSWRRFNLTGVSQGGKTLAGSAIPVMFYLFERRETVIYAAPTTEMAADKWRKDILPVIKASSYAHLLPESGAGSRGGAAAAIEFKHGPTLRFMTGGGSDKTVAGFTSRVVVITEVDGMDEAGDNSREADRISQLETRTNAFGDDARIFLECTTSTEDGRTWRELKDGTDSRLALPCPHCSHWVTPEREHLVGWQDAKSVVEARESARLNCPHCSAAWDEEDRAQANRGAKLVHKGQDVTEDGTVVGLVPKTLTLGFRFTAANNLLVSMQRVAEEEWSAPRRTDPDLAEKKLRQFYWTLPSDPESITLSAIDVAEICARTVELPRGRIPLDATNLTIGIDVGKWLCHWVLIAWRPGGTPHVADYGALSVPSATMAEEVAILAALRSFRDETCAQGWPLIGELDSPKMMRVSLSVVDSGNWESTVVAFCRESGPGFLPTKGFGIRQLGGRKIAHDPGYELAPQQAGHALLEINADFWKSWLHARLQTPAGQPGGLTLFHATANEHLSFARHLTAEKKVEDYVPGRGNVTRWERVNKANHWLDAGALASVAGHGVGARLVEAVMPARERPPQQNCMSAAEWMSKGKRW